MFKVKVIAVGKCKEEWLRIAIAEYEKRLSPLLQMSWIQADDDSQLPLLLRNETFIALDPAGISYDSIAFSQHLLQAIEKTGSRITFAIGGPNGFPTDLLQKAYLKWSLSPLTFTHQLTRLVLIEQIYRSLEISKKSPYHK
ncbi:MAG: rlmH [Parachlamydiales bacterium]|nr:rlmH [Parachlamydiales bacterium]